MPFVTLLQDEQFERNTKSMLLIIVTGIFFFLLIVRLAFLQIIEADLNIRLSQENAWRLHMILPPRGCVYDRNGEILARNRPSYSVCVMPSQLKHRKEVIARLCAIRDSTGARVFDSLELEATVKKAYARRYDQTRLREDVSLDLMSIIEEHSMELPGISVVSESRREYTLGPMAFHALGYMSEIPEDEVDSLRKIGYYYGDVIGKAGIECQYEKTMRGVCGQEYIEVDARGRIKGPVTDIPRIEPMPGHDLVLTLDARLQRAAAAAFPDSLKGAVVAIDPRNGEVLVLFSHPSVDPNIFSMSGTLRSKSWTSIAIDSSLPLNNRCISGTYSPGSTFKLVSALAGLETGDLTASSHMPVACNGAFRFGSRIAHCWEKKGHGSLDLIQAIQVSCDVYFYQVGLLLGDAVINKYASEVGLGAVTGIDIPNEKEGWLSGEAAYNRRYKPKGWVWTRGLLLDMGIGQIQVVTPLQLACMVGDIGNGAAFYQPHLVMEEKTRDGAVARRYPPVLRDSLKFNPTTIATLRTAMLKVMGPGGTGGLAAIPDIPVGGKTGSAQNPQGEKTHALFAACAPIDDPVIAVAVVVENAGHGGSIAAPVAGAVLRSYFSETEEGKAITEKYKALAAAKRTKPQAGN